MARKRDRKEVDLAVEAIGGLLIEAVQATITDRVPGPARECAEEFAAIDDGVAPDDEGGPTGLMATLTLVRWLSSAREELLDRPARVDEVLAWIEDALGRRYRARARYTSGMLESEAGVRESMEYVDALQEDFLPSLIWLVAGVVAVYHEGDVGWLRRLHGPDQVLSRAPLGL
ncbi:hypothetical protein [Pseudonocardia kunmingensis]|uniref:Uncharacterized protein n=1 Tax=Pseudonocardia kunmingensis TaxID=630975 RepID=A0A543CXA6_9PSEU|nr:hypothetical protein [Pseudonocardia kunmingensis]TQM01730.1 hypothetical protein FB558_8244 [Pseudonocardia kunmingensis]